MFPQRKPLSIAAHAKLCEEVLARCHRLASLQWALQDVSSWLTADAFYDFECPAIAGQSGRTHRIAQVADFQGEVDHLLHFKATAVTPNPDVWKLIETINIVGQYETS